MQTLVYQFHLDIPSSWFAVVMAQERPKYAVARNKIPICKARDGYIY